MPEHCMLVDQTPAASTRPEPTSDDLSRIAGILVQHLQQAGAHLPNESTLDEAKRLLVEMVRAARAGNPGGGLRDNDE